MGRHLTWAATAAAAAPLGIPILLTAALAGGALGDPSAGDLAGTSAMSSEGCTADPASPGVEAGRGERLGAAQIANASIIAATGAALGVPARGQVIAIAAAMQESRLRNLHHGDRDSLGLFQQRAAWGSVTQRTDPVQAARMFYAGGHDGQPGLLNVPGWQHLPLTAAAQAVQRSAYPDAYAQWEPMATRLQASSASGGQACDAGSPGGGATSAHRLRTPALPPDTPPSIRAAITWALSQLGTPYHYGGDCTASHSGDPRRQCDCSSLVQHAFFAAGIRLPRTTAQQRHSGAAVYNLRSLLPGDLIFLSEHVGIYLGEGLVLHAPKTGDVVKIAPVRGYWTRNTIAVRRITGQMPPRPAPASTASSRLSRTSRS